MKVLLLVFSISLFGCGKKGASGGISDPVPATTISGKRCREDLACQNLCLSKTCSQRGGVTNRTCDVILKECLDKRI